MENLNIINLLLATQNTNYGSGYMIGVVIILVLSLLIIINYFVAKEFYSIVVQKGYSKRKYFWMCFFLGIIGYLLVIALPNTKTKDKPSIDDSERVAQK